MPFHRRVKKLLFLNFPKKKKKGVIRIGTFGDSYTYGDEVSDGNDYPSYLNRLFVKNAPNRKIEILNFGKGALGFQQTFMMWEKYATEYDLDYILLGPTGFEFFDRDVSFATNLRQRIKTDGPPKARYILTPDGKKLREIHLKGHTLWERYKRFYRLIPSWNQIRYDRCPFQALDDYFPFLWCPPSPLYYTNLTEPEEAIKINAILLKKMILKFPGKVLLLVRSNTTEDSDKEYALYQNINFIDINTIQMPQLFLYVRRSHRSNLGYEIWAESFFYALTGRSRFSIQTLSCNKKDNSITKIKPLDLKFPLNGVKHISLFSNDFNMGELIINSPGYNWQKELAFKIPKDTKSFIVFHSQDFTHSPVVVPISFPLTKGDKVFIGPPESDNRMFLGEINPLDERHIFFEFPLHHLERQKFIGFIHDDMEPAVAINIKSPHTRHPFIYVNDQAFGKLVPAGFPRRKAYAKATDNGSHAFTDWPGSKLQPRGFAKPANLLLSIPDERWKGV